MKSSLVLFILATMIVFCAGSASAKALWTGVETINYCRDIPEDKGGGSWVLSTSGTPIYKIGDPEGVWFNGNVFESVGDMQSVQIKNRLLVTSVGTVVVDKVRGGSRLCVEGAFTERKQGAVPSTVQLFWRPEGAVAPSKP